MWYLSQLQLIPPDLRGWGTGLGPRQWMGNEFFHMRDGQNVLKQISIVWDLLPWITRMQHTKTGRYDISINRGSHQNSEYLDRWIWLKLSAKENGMMCETLARWSYLDIRLPWVRHEVEAVLQKLLSSPEAQWSRFFRVLQSSDQFMVFVLLREAS